MSRTPRKGIRIAAVAAVVVAATMALGWWVVIPQHRAGLQPGEGYGIDVSNHQGSIDWTKVAADGVGSAYLKATEGRSFVDPYFANNWAGRPQWRTSFFVRPSGDWAVWQVHYFARVDGVTGKVDLDVVRPAQLVS